MQTSARSGSSSEETRARIIAAAKEIYESNGTRGTTTRLVAERAGVNEATLFRHFGSKQALLYAMRDQTCPLAYFDKVLASLTGNLRNDLYVIARTLIERMHGQRAMICISLAENAQEETLTGAPEWRGPLVIRDRLERFLATQIEAGRIHGNATRLAAFFMGMCFSYVIARQLWASEVINADDIDGMVDMFLNGVK